MIKAADVSACQGINSGQVVRSWSALDRSSAGHPHASTGHTLAPLPRSQRWPKSSYMRKVLLSWEDGACLGPVRARSRSTFHVKTIASHLTASADGTGLLSHAAQAPLRAAPTVPAIEEYLRACLAASSGPVPEGAALLAQSHEPHWSAPAFDLGCADQAHLIRDSHPSSVNPPSTTTTGKMPHGAGRPRRCRAVERDHCNRAVRMPLSVGTERGIRGHPVADPHAEPLPPPVCSVAVRSGSATETLERRVDAWIGRPGHTDLPRIAGTLDVLRRTAYPERRIRC